MFILSRKIKRHKLKKIQDIQGIAGSFSRGQFLLESLADLVCTQYFLSFYQHYTQPIYQQHTLYHLNTEKSGKISSLQITVLINCRIPSNFKATPKNSCVSVYSLFHYVSSYPLQYKLNPLCPNIHIQILQTHLLNLIKEQGIFSLVIILLILRN